MKFFITLLLLTAGSNALAHEGHFSLGHPEQLGIFLMMVGILLASVYVFLQRKYGTEELAEELAEEKTKGESASHQAPASLNDIGGKNYV